MPDKPDPELYDIMQVGTETYAVVHAGTETVVVLNGVPQIGFDIQTADDIADHLEAIARITASRGTGALNS